MPKKNLTTRRVRTEQDYQDLAASRNFIWLGPFPRNVGIPTQWECPHGHKWNASFGNVKQGTGCPHCTPNVIPKAEVDYHRIAAKKGFEWIGLSIKNTSEPTEWRCPQGHRWSAPYQHVKKLRGCPLCAKNRRLTEQHYRDLAQQHNAEWLGPFPEDSNAPSQWRCEEGHIREANYREFKSQPHCSYCKGKNTVRKTPADYHRIASKSGIIWLGPEVAETKSFTNWQCPKGHVWLSNYNKMQSGYGCPYCAGTAPLTAGDYAYLAELLGMFWLGPMPDSIGDKTNWQCQDGHVFTTTYAILKRSGLCPNCQYRINGQKTSRQQRKLAEMLSGEVNHRVGTKSVDIAIVRDGIQIAVEYDAWYWHGERQSYDAERDQYLISQDWRVLHVKSDDFLPALSQLNAAIATLLAGETYTEIILDDWGKGPTFHGPD